MCKNLIYLFIFQLIFKFIITLLRFDLLLNSNSTLKSLTSLFSSFLNGLVFETFFVTTRIAATYAEEGVMAIVTTMVNPGT